MCLPLINSLLHVKKEQRHNNGQATRPNNNTCAFHLYDNAMLILSCSSKTIPSALQILLAQYLQHLKLVGYWLGVVELQF